MTERTAALYGLALGLCVALAVATPQTPNAQQPPQEKNILGKTSCNAEGSNIWIRRSTQAIAVETIQHEGIHAWQCQVLGHETFNRAARDPRMREMLELEAITGSLRMIGRTPAECADEALDEAMVYGFPSDRESLKGKILILCADF